MAKGVSEAMQKASEVFMVACSWADWVLGALGLGIIGLKLLFASHKSDCGGESDRGGKVFL